MGLPECMTRVLREKRYEIASSQVSATLILADESVVDQVGAGVRANTVVLYRHGTALTPADVFRFGKQGFADVQRQPCEAQTLLDIVEKALAPKP
jgi:hypothetical protein